MSRNTLEIGIIIVALVLAMGLSVYAGMRLAPPSDAAIQTAISRTMVAVPASIDAISTAISDGLK